ncbi:MAG TPA: YihY/virulence factor BrkB family protein [Saprospiraceae bacterium]|nr:YihY/virulence factor BrkB family protein [Saprospiraceae bacterium]
MNRKATNIVNRIIQSRMILSLLEWAKTKTLPGFDGVAVYDALEFVFREFKKDDVSVRSKAMAQSFFLALFPAIIFLLTLLPYIPLTLDYFAFWKESLQGILPMEAEKFIFGILDNLSSKNQYGSQALSLLLLLYFTSNGVSTMMDSFAKSYHESYKTRNFFQQKFVAMQITLLMIVLLILSTTLIILGNLLLNSIFQLYELGMTTRYIIELLRWFVVIGLFYTTISLLFRFGPAMKRKMRFISPGAGVATLLTILSSLGFSYFVNTFGRYNEIYGSIGAIIILMVWLEFNTLALLAGYELNAAIAVNRDLKNVVQYKRSPHCNEPNELPEHSQSN